MDFQDHISRYLHPLNYEASIFNADVADVIWLTQPDQPVTEPLGEFADAPEWKEIPSRRFPRVLPSPRDNTPGVKDHSLIKSILRRSGMLD